MFSSKLSNKSIFVPCTGPIKVERKITIGTVVLIAV